MTEILIIFGLLIGTFYMMMRTYSKMIDFFLAMPLAKEIIGESSQDDFYELLNKYSKGEELTEHERTRLKRYIKSSPLPNDLLDRTPSKFTLMQKVVIALSITIVMLKLRFMGFFKNENKDESNRNQ